MSKRLRCPTCGSLVPRSAAGFPFCGDCCRRVDLGKWASGKYVISSPLAEPEAAALDQAPPFHDDDTH